MADIFKKQIRSRVMAAIRSKGNKATELRLVAILRATGIRGWRRHQPLPGRPDFVFRRERLVIFVDGCFWHGCPRHFRMPKSNREYWERKLGRNIRRDRGNNKSLRKAGWQVLRFWQHSLDKPHLVASRIILHMTAAQVHYR
ncbi:MAG TPA: very short patch repair endonuclease [Verrucomicrobiae bacterium]|nr:very short patch repair endonuclease [Verrucomicrobiae bacterium]